VFIDVSEELSEKLDLQSGNASARSDPADAGFLSFTDPHGKSRRQADGPSLFTVTDIAC
jgi:hypothetical protein